MYPFGANSYQQLAHILKATTARLGVRVWTWDSLPMPNFVTIA